MFLRAGKSDKQGADKGSIRIIWITIGFANTAGILSAIFLKVPLSSLIILPYLGSLLSFIGVGLSLNTIYLLKLYFSSLLKFVI